MEGVKASPAQETLIRETFQLRPDEACPRLTPVEGGITNTSFRFHCKGEDCILREPGEDSKIYLDRYREEEAYLAVADLGITDELHVLEPHSGRKISRFWPNARICDPHSDEDVAACMALLRRLHDSRRKITRHYDIYKLNQYFLQWMPRRSVYPDYPEVSRRCLEMRPILEELGREQVLSHCDTVAANFLFVTEQGETKLRLIDWEYAGMYDPCVDLGMFANDGSYTPGQVDRMIRHYLGEAPTPEFTLRVYGYLAFTGFMFSNWEEYMRGRGVDCGDYGRIQYHNASVYSALFWELLDRIREGENE